MSECNSTTPTPVLTTWSLKTFSYADFTEDSKGILSCRQHQAKETRHLSASTTSSYKEEVVSPSVRTDGTDTNSPKLQEMSYFWQQYSLTSKLLQHQCWNTVSKAWGVSSWLLLLQSTTSTTFLHGCWVWIRSLCSTKPEQLLRCSLCYSRCISYHKQWLSTLIKHDWSCTQEKWLKDNYIPSHITITVGFLHLFLKDCFLFLDSCW